MSLAAKDVGRLCRAVSRRKPYWVAVVLFEQYMDETGTHDSAPVVGASAYLATSEQWETFTGCWSPVLEEFGVKVFHATDYEAREGEFKGWDIEKKLAFAKKLFPILPANTWMGMGNAIVTRDWDDVLQGHAELRSQLGAPYLGCFQRIIDRLLMAFRMHPPDDCIAVFVEDNDFKGEILKIWDNWFRKVDTQGRLVSITFGAKADFVPLQAADALAYEAYKALDNERYAKGRTRKSLQVMQSTGNIGVFISDRRNLPKMIEIAEETLAKIRTGQPL